MTVGFAGLDDGTLNEFDTTVTGGGDLSAHVDAARIYSHGLRAVINGTDAIYGRFDELDSTEIRVGFFFDPNGYSDTSDTIRIAGGGSAMNAQWWINLAYTGSQHTVRLWVSTDGDPVAIDAEDIDDDWNWIEIRCKIATGAGQNDGIAQMWVNSDVTGPPDAENTSIDNDTKDYDYFCFGAANIDAGTDETIYFDHICWNDTGAAIGPPSEAAPWRLRTRSVRQDIPVHQLQL